MAPNTHTLQPPPPTPPSPYPNPTFTLPPPQQLDREVWLNTQLLSQRVARYHVTQTISVHFLYTRSITLPELLFLSVWSLVFSLYFWFPLKTNADHTVTFDIELRCVGVSQHDRIGNNVSCCLASCTVHCCFLIFFSFLLYFCLLIHPSIHPSISPYIYLSVCMSAGLPFLYILI